MPLADLLNRACLIVQRAEADATDDYGNPATTETVVETVCELQQTRRDEPVSQGELSRTTWLLILPAGTSLDTGDAVEVDGHRYELVGDPWEARNPRTQSVSHLEATVVRTAGQETAS